MKILLSDWAARNYSPPPSAWTLRAWIRKGQIYPPPELVGSSYYVSEDARRQLSPRPTVLQRMKAVA